MIRYLQGDATRPQGPGPKIIAHICNDRGRWGKGFVLALSARWPEPEQAYKAWAKTGDWLGEPFGLGALQLVEVPDTDIVVANLVAQHGLRPQDGVPPIRYGALETALHKLQIAARQRCATLHMPRIGCGLAGGEWSKVEKLLSKLLGELQVNVYDFAAG